jgi:hypothetical protein
MFRIPQEKFPGHAVQEMGAIYEITPPELAWFTGQSPQPLEARIADPRWTPPNGISEELKRRSYPQGNRDTKAVAMLVYPPVLLRCAESHPEHIRPRVIDRLDMQLVFS